MTVTVDGESIEYHYNNSPIAIKIPNKKSYTLTLPQLPDCNISGPYTYTFTAVGGMTRQLNVEYIEIIPNVYIMGVSGKLYKKSQWDNSELANGLVIHNDSHSFLFTTEDYKAGTNYMFLGTNPLLSDPTANFLSLDNDKALIDYDGQGNTERIKYYLENSTEENKVDYKIRWEGTLNFINNETFRDGTKAYIGSCGELNMLIDNFDEVNETLSLLGLPTLVDLPYDMAYTSTMEVNEDKWNVYRLHGENTNLREGIYSTNCFGLGAIYKYGKYTFKRL